MLYLRLLIGVVLIIICCKIGKNKGNKYKTAYNFYESLICFCNSFKGDLLYKKSNLKDFIDLNYTSLEFKIILDNYINNQIMFEDCDFLSDEERLEVYNFLSNIGTSDSVSQIEIINGYYAKFNQKLLEKHEEFKKYYTLSSKLGFVIGLAFMIMVI